MTHVVEERFVQAGVLTFGCICDGDSLGTLLELLEAFLQRIVRSETLLLELIRIRKPVHTIQTNQRGQRIVFRYLKIYPFYIKTPLCRIRNFTNSGMSAKNHQIVTNKPKYSNISRKNLQGGHRNHFVQLFFHTSTPQQKVYLSPSCSLFSSQSKRETISPVSRQTLHVNCQSIFIYKLRLY